MPSSGNYLLRIAPAAARATGNKTEMQNVTTLVDHFHGRDSVPVLNCAHRLMEEVRGFHKSH
jgi:hypothetical protein